jgi:hypothetical protein
MLNTEIPNDPFIYFKEKLKYRSTLKKKTLQMFTVALVIMTPKQKCHKCPLIEE